MWDKIAIVLYLGTIAAEPEHNRDTVLKVYFNVKPKNIDILCCKKKIRL